METMRTVYLDHAATTPADPRVVEAMMPYFSDIFGNTSSGHRFGRNAERAIDNAREQIASVLGCDADEIVFTGGGTESDNLAIRGSAYPKRETGRTRLVTTGVEHSAVGRTIAQLAQYAGFNATTVPVDRTGLVDVEELSEAVGPDVSVVSIIAANNEVGTIQPIAGLAEAAHRAGALFHTDAVQAAGQIPLDVRALDVDMLSISAHKFYGPKGVGALYVRRGVQLVPSQSGGSHEEGRRAGTLNTPGIVGMGLALRLAQDEMEARTAHYRRLRDLLTARVLETIPQAKPTGHSQFRLPSHASFQFDGLDGNMLQMHLDLKGVAVSSASACKTGNPEPSGVLLAMGYSTEQALGSVRLTVGKDTTEADVEYAVIALQETVDRLYRLRQEYA